MLESSDKTWFTGEGNGKPLQYSCLENPMNTMKRQKDRTLKDKLPRFVCAQYATGDQWRNSFRRYEEAEDIEASKICRGRRWWMVVKREAEPQGSL